MSSAGSTAGEDVSAALVLAAGKGARLNHDTPKPAFPLLGVPLLARTLITLQESGITDAYVVVGYQAREVREAIEGTRGLEIEVHWIHNDRWDKPNGLSVLAARSELDEPFVLTMGDHVFPAEFVALLREHGGGEGVDLVVDRNVDDGHDLDDATKVRLDSDRIVEIGKSVESFDALDTGVFLATPALFRALGDCESPNPSLSDGVQRLADAGLARAVDGTDRIWHDVDEPEDVGVAEDKILSTLTKETDGPVSRHLNRPVSLAISRRLVDWPVTPNQVSVGTLVISLISAVFAAVGGYVPWLVSGLLFQLASVLDGTDGELAKLTYRASVRGQWVDTVCDNISYVACLVGLTVGVYRADLPGFYLWAGAAGIVSTALSLANINVHLMRLGDTGSALDVEYGYEEGIGPASRILRGLHYLGKRDVFSLILLGLAVVGQLPLALVLFGVGVTTLLLPATTWVNLSSFLDARAASRPDRVSAEEPSAAAPRGHALSSPGAESGEAVLSAVGTEEVGAGE